MPLLPVVLVHAQGARLPHGRPVLGRPDIRRLLRSHLCRRDVGHGRHPRPRRLAVAVHHRGCHHRRRGHRLLFCPAQLPPDDEVADGGGEGVGCVVRTCPCTCIVHATWAACAVVGRCPWDANEQARRLEEDIGEDDWVNSEEQTFWQGAKLAFTDFKTYILVSREQHPRRRKKKNKS